MDDNVGIAVAIVASGVGGHIIKKKIGARWITHLAF